MCTYVLVFCKLYNKQYSYASALLYYLFVCITRVYPLYAEPTHQRHVPIHNTYSNTIVTVDASFVI